jgi:predicted ester cyclase
MTVSPVFQYTPVDQTHNMAAKKRVVAHMQALASAPPSALLEAAHEAYHPDAAVHVTHPINELAGPAAAVQQFWGPLRAALPDIQRREDLVAGGRYRDAHWVACLGHYIGTLELPWLGIPPTRRVVTVRYAEAHQLRDGRISSSYVFVDFLDVMRQAGYWPVAPSLGAEIQWQPPATHDGVLLGAQDNDISRESIERVLRMHAALGLYNRQPPTRQVLDEMQMAQHWHPHFMWYGPAGIGTARGLRQFEDYHQIPFLVAFPDRGGTAIGHFIRVGDGRYAVTGGWGSLQGTHTGPDFLGMSPTGRRIRMRVMDFYRCDDTTIVENWIPMDIPHMLLQMGVDVFGRMRYQFPQHVPISVSEWLLRG